MNPKKQYVYSLKGGKDGLYIERKGTQRTVMQWPDDGRDAQRIGVRRFQDEERAATEEDVRREDREGGDVKEHQLPTDQEMVDEESENYIS